MTNKMVEVTCKTFRNSETGESFNAFYTKDKNGNDFRVHFTKKCGDPTSVTGGQCITLSVSDMWIDTRLKDNPTLRINAYSVLGVRDVPAVGKMDDLAFDDLPF